MFKKIIATGAILAMAVSTAQAAPQLVFDNISNYENTVANAAITGTSSTPNTFLGDGYTLLNGTTSITGFDIFPGNLTTTTYTNLKGTIYFWGTVNTGTVSATTPAFSNLLFTYTVNISNAANSFPTGQYYPLEGATPGTTPGLTFATPLAISSNTIGVTMSFQGSTDNGVTYATANSLNEIISYGTAPTVGSQVFNGYYRNANSESDGNFTSTLRTLGLTNQSIALRVYGNVAAAPEPSQYAAFGLGILGIGAMALKARRRSVLA